MPKIKPPVKTPRIDMTPMVDLFSLLLIFFVLTASFRPTEAAMIDSPNSVSEKQAPDFNLMTIFIDKEGKVFFNVDNGQDSTTKFREQILRKMAERYEMTFTEDEYDLFGRLSSFGMPLKDLKGWINAENSEERDKLNVGIPYDSTDNQLGYWILYSRIVNPRAEVAIKGDADANYMDVKKIMDMLQDNKVNKFNLITTQQVDEVTLDDIPPEK
ncbi:MAG: biopolymer transporter ExbD [Bacteroidales bacterium]|nr:biopolymer transporter ExbD [Bacteroidales bacterium]